jgi:hypothetical protein
LIFYVRFSPQKRTLIERVEMSALCQTQSHAPQQKVWMHASEITPADSSAGAPVRCTEIVLPWGDRMLDEINQLFCAVGRPPTPEGPSTRRRVTVSGTTVGILYTPGSRGVTSHFDRFGCGHRA